MKIINVMAVSLDGKISSNPAESDRDRRGYGFTNQADQEHVRSLILRADAIVTGANSMRASGGAWEQRNSQGQYPLWVVLTAKGLEPSLRFWQQSQIPRWLVSEARLPNEELAPEVVRKESGAQDLARYLYKELLAAKVETVLLFGGGAVNALFYKAGLVDELRITICPIVVGSPQASNFVDPRLASPQTFRLESSLVVENHVFLNYQSVKC